MGKMTEQMAIEELKDFITTDDAEKYVDGVDTLEKAVEVAIQALEEIQQYRAIGTVEELQALKEKSVAKKPVLSMNEKSGMFVDYADGHGEYKVQTNNWWRCPCCNSVVGERYTFRGRTHDQRKKEYCEKCGTKLDWK